MPSERDREFLSPVFYTAAPKSVCIRRLAGARRLSPLRFVNTVTIGWIGAPNGRAPFRFHRAVVGLVDRCLSRTRNLAASNKHLAGFFSSAQELFFSGFLKSLKLFFLKICAHGERYRNLLAGIFEILTFFGNIAFPLSLVLVVPLFRLECGDTPRWVAWRHHTLGGQQRN